MLTLESVLVLFVVFATIAVIFVLYIRRESATKDDRKKGKYEFDRVCEATREYITNELDVDYGEKGLKRNVLNAMLRQQQDLRDATLYAAKGDAGKREYLKDKIREFLTDKYGISSDNIERVIPYNEPHKMSAADKWGLLYARYKRIKKYNVTKEIFITNGWDHPKEYNGIRRFIVDEGMVNTAYADCSIPETYLDRLEMLTQRIYEKVYGNDVADVFIMDDSVNGVHGGVGGREIRSFDYRKKLEEISGISSDLYTNCEPKDMLWIDFMGKIIWLKFLSFGSIDNLERVVQNVYSYHSRTMLSQTDPVLQGTLATGSRSFVLRPSVTPTPIFFVRNYAGGKARTLAELFPQTNGDALEKVIEFVFKALFSGIISGDPNCGKTTLLKTCVQYWANKTVRTIEEKFELDLNTAYPEMNVVQLQAWSNHDIYECLRDTRRMDTQIVILGEMNAPNLAGALIQNIQSGSQSGWTTAHFNSVKMGIEYLRNANIAENQISDANIAEQQVVDCINIDIHCKVDREKGEYYVERISEIWPSKPEKIPEGASIEKILTAFVDTITNRKNYEYHDIVVFDREKGRYVVKNCFSEYNAVKAASVLGENSVKEMQDFLRSEILSVETDAIGKGKLQCYL